MTSRSLSWLEVALRRCLRCTQTRGGVVPRHRAKEFLKFLRRIDKETLPCLDLHLILDNYATHETPAVQRWLKRHPRFKLHFTPTSSSWLNLVERCSPRSLASEYAEASSAAFPNSRSI